MLSGVPPTSVRPILSCASRSRSELTIEFSNREERVQRIPFQNLKDGFKLEASVLASNCLKLQGRI
jgi:hypothetical protein